MWCSTSMDRNWQIGPVHVNVTCWFCACGMAFQYGSILKSQIPRYKLPPCMARNALGRVVCGVVYGDMHLKDLLGLIKYHFYTWNDNRSVNPININPSFNRSKSVFKTMISLSCDYNTVITWRVFWHSDNMTCVLTQW